MYIEPAGDFCGPDWKLNEALYRSDHIHLVEAGYKIFARSISDALLSAMRRERSDAGQKRGLHCIDINANSILSKIEEINIIAHKTRAAVIGISESKLDETVLNGEIIIMGYKILRSDRNRNEL